MVDVAKIHCVGWAALNAFNHCLLFQLQSKAYAAVMNDMRAKIDPRFIQSKEPINPGFLGSAQAEPGPSGPLVTVLARDTANARWCSTRLLFVDQRQPAEKTRCIVLDCGWSKRKGDFYEVAIYGQESEEITAWEMGEMWASRV
ncbi:hypothetical protein FRB94_014233 [Tulasnella sp. JGI-2019a]|nr:hypothetical protein FRB93_005421 [Tulasnella sp. JGI-2019a]KAG9014140.1 hypothetical protein FRB94_014233 [Tulasnella sp. JGI-2019a]KAG9021283.1 hypothetical protein FRB95_002444 [Tulasnella sp. JGI-2019a]